MSKILMIVAVAALMSSAVEAKEYVVKMKFDAESGKVYFEPKRVDVRSGDQVTWVQADRENQHNVVAYPEGIPKGTDTFKGPMLKRDGQRWSMVFTKSGTYKYHCHPHEAMGMRGMVVVDRESLAGEFRKMRHGEHAHGAEKMPEIADSMGHKMKMGDGHSN